MLYSLVEHPWSAEQAAKLKSLLQCDEIRLLAKKGGGNSVVYCVEGNNGQQWAVKSYPPYAPNQRDRLAAELLVYQFLNQHQVPAVPSLKTYSESERWLVIDWIAGDIPSDYSLQDVEQALLFIYSIHQLNALPEAQQLPLAAEACLSLTILLNQISQRLQRLQSLPDTETDLHLFLTQQFQPLFEQCQKQALTGYQKHKMDANAELPQAYRSLIAADFGFHNTIRDQTGKLYFFDFDYFGWDDPVKLLADILWHPKMQLSPPQKQRFIQGFSAIYALDPQFLHRFHYTWPLFGLRWVLILLNEFIPAFWQNRQHADVYQDQTEAKRIQLKRATELLSNVQHSAVSAEPRQQTAEASL